MGTVLLVHGGCPVVLQVTPDGKTRSFPLSKSVSENLPVVLVLTNEGPCCA